MNDGLKHTLDMDVKQYYGRLSRNASKSALDLQFDTMVDFILNDYASEFALEEDEIRKAIKYITRATGRYNSLSDV